MKDSKVRRWAAGLVIAGLVAVGLGAWLALSGGGSTGPPSGMAFLGVRVHSVDGGAEILSVTPRTPAAGAGLRPARKKPKRLGDIITAIDGTDIGSSEELVGAIDLHRPGDKVLVTFKRGGYTTWVRLKLATKPAAAAQR